MAGNKPNMFSVIETLIKSVFSKLESRIGKINLLGGFIILLVALAFMLAPVAHYCLQAVQSICNTILILNNKEPMKIDVSAPSMGEITIWMIIIFVESIICGLIVHFSERKKDELGLTPPKTDPKTKG